MLVKSKWRIEIDARRSADRTFLRRPLRQPESGLRDRQYDGARSTILPPPSDLMRGVVLAYPTLIDFPNTAEEWRQAYPWDRSLLAVKLRPRTVVIAGRSPSGSSAALCRQPPFRIVVDELHARRDRVGTLLEPGIERAGGAGIVDRAHLVVVERDRGAAVIRRALRQPATDKR